MRRKNLLQLLLTLAALASIGARAFAANISITGTENSSQFFTEDNQQLIIGSGGSLELTSPTAAAISVDSSVSSPLSGLQISVDSGNSTTGIIVPDNNDFSAINISGDHSISAITLTSGLISNGSNSAATISLTGGGGTETIETDSGTIIKNNAGQGTAINSDTTNNTALTINNAGTIKTGDGSATYTVNSTAINFNDADGGSSLTINNTGSINASALDLNADPSLLNGKVRYAISAGGTGNNIIINNNGTGTIDGDISIGANNATITNSSTADGAIGGTVSATTGKLTFTMSAGTLDGNQDLVGSISLGSNAESSLTVSGTGVILGRVDLGNASQEIIFNGGGIAGEIFGSDGSSGFGGKILIDATTQLNGSIHSASSVSIADGKSLDIATNFNSIEATSINIGDASTFIVGTSLTDGLGDVNNEVTVTGEIKASTAGTSNFEVKSDFRFTSNSDIGAATVASVTHSFDEVRINDGASLNLATNNNSIFADHVIIYGNGSLEVGSGNINSSITSDISSYNGSVIFNDNSAVTGVVGIGSFGLDSVEIASGKTVSVGDDNTILAYSMATKSLILGGSTTLNLGQTPGLGTIVSANGFSFIDSSGGSNTINGNINTETSDSTITLALADAINGNLKVTTGKLSLDATSGTIVGDVDLGSNSASAITFNGSTFQGNITMNNASQEVSLSTTASIITGATIDSTGSINGAGNLIIGLTPDTFNFNIGDITEITSLQIGADVTLDASTHENIIRATSITLDEDSQLTLGTATTSGNITGTAAGNGDIIYATVAISGPTSTSKNYNIGTSDSYADKINSVAISDSVALTNQGNIMANVIALGTGSSLTSTSGVIGSSDGIISLNGVDSSVVANGTSSVVGFVAAHFSDQGEYRVGSTYTNNFDIGSNGTTISTIHEFAVDATGNLSTNANIYTTNTDISGTLNLTGTAQSMGDIDAPTTVAVLAGGILNIGNGAQTINGSLTIGNTGSIGVKIDSATTSGQIMVSGLATIAANTVLKITLEPSIHVTAGTTFQILSSSSSVSAINNVKITNNSSGSNVFDGLRYSTEVFGDNLLIVTSTAEISVQTDNRESQTMLGVVNNMISAGNASGKFLQFQDYLLNDTTSNAQANTALQSATPQSNNSLHRSMFAVLNNSISAIDDRLDATFGNSKKLKNGISSGDANYSHESWAQTFGLNANQGKFGGIEGYNLNSSGFAFGSDKVVEDFGNAHFGLAASYMNSNIKSESGSKKTNISTYQVNAYSSHKFGNYFLENIIGFALNDYRSNRSIASVGVNADSQYFGKSFIAKMKGSEHFYFAQNFDFIPQISVNFVHNQIDHHHENNADNMSLFVKNSSSDFLEGRIGFDLAHKNLVGETQFVQTLRASYGYDFIGDRQITTSNFADQTTSFSSQISKVNRQSLKLGIGFDILRTDAISFKFDYNYEHKTAYNSHSGIIKAKYEF